MIVEQSQVYDNSQSTQVQQAMTEFKRQQCSKHSASPLTPNVVFSKLINNKLLILISSSVNLLQGVEITSQIPMFSMHLIPYSISLDMIVRESNVLMYFSFSVDYIP